MTRGERVTDAWRVAYAKVSPALDEYYSKNPAEPCFLERLKEYAPGAFSQIQAAEKEAEEASIRWRDGGPGGVQVVIDRWVSAWLEGIAVVMS